MIEEDAARVRHEGAPSRNHGRYMERGVCESERQEAWVLAAMITLWSRAAVLVREGRERQCADA